MKFTTDLDFWIQENYLEIPRYASFTLDGGVEVDEEEVERILSVFAQKANVTFTGAIEPMDDHTDYYFFTPDISFEHAEELGLFFGVN